MTNRIKVEIFMYVVDDKELQNGERRVSDADD
jgi:hypothetical protein